MDVCRDRPYILVCLLVTNIARAQYLLYFPWYKQFLEFGREVVDAVWDPESEVYIGPSLPEVHK
jgi:hypothetical protein